MCEGKNNTCQVPTTNCTLSEHWFCTGCRIEHEAHMATGFLNRAGTAGDWYLIPEALLALENVRKFADMLEAEVRDIDRDSDEGLDAEDHDEDFFVGRQAHYQNTATSFEVVDVTDRRWTQAHGIEYLTRSAYGLHRWVRWSKLFPLVEA